MYNADANVQMISTQTAEEIRYFEAPSPYNSAKFYNNIGETFTMFDQNSATKVLGLDKKILASVPAIVRDIKDDEVLIELKFPEKAIVVYMERTLFSEINNLYIGLQIDYRIVRDSSGIRKQEFVAAATPKEVSNRVLELREKIFSMLEDD